MLGFTVAIDGPAAAGKGTVGRAVAAHFGFAHLDTGLLYRAVGAKVLDGMTAEEAALTLQADDLEDDQLRTNAVAEAASLAAAIPAVRAALVDFQRSFAMRAGSRCPRQHPRRGTLKARRGCGTDGHLDHGYRNSRGPRSRTGGSTAGCLSIWERMVPFNVGPRRAWR